MNAPTPAGGPGPALRAFNRLALYLTLALVAGIASASLTLITPSLPSLQEQLGISVAELGASQAAYLICIAVPQLLYGSYSDRIGRRRPLLVGLVLFTLGSVAATFAFDVWSLIAARLFQAVGASAGMVVSRGIVRDMHPEGRMASIMGFLAMAMMVIPMIAPALGGVVQDSFGWTGNFWLLAAIGAALIVASVVWLPGGRPAQGPQQRAGGALRTLVASRRFHFFTMQFALSSATNQLFFITAPFIMERQFGQAPSAYGYWFSLPPLLYFAGNMFSGMFAERAGTIRMVLTGTLGAGAACLLWVAVFAAVPVPSFGLFLVMGSIALFHGLVTPSAVAGSTGAISGAYGLASGLAGAIQALACAAIILWATAAGVETASALLWVISGIAWVCVLLSLLLMPRVPRV
jgi:DHA1 family bicyclomycin/chloramphenicol resistance-like MFS transporter